MALVKCPHCGSNTGYEYIRKALVHNEAGWGMEPTTLGEHVQSSGEIVKCTCQVCGGEITQAQAFHPTGFKPETRSDV